MGIGDKLGFLLEEQGRNINELATEIDVSPNTLYSIVKRNNTKVDLDILQKIADELSVTLDYFCTDAKYDTDVPLILNDTEKKVIISYRSHKEMQPAINKMLDIEDKGEMKHMLKSDKYAGTSKIVDTGRAAAYGGERTTINITEDKAKKIHEIKNILEDNED